MFKFINLIMLTYNYAGVIIITILLSYALTLYCKSRLSIKTAKTRIKFLNEKSRMTTNKFANMTVAEMENYFRSVMSLILEIESTNISANDPTSSITLYTQTLIKFLEYFNDSNSAISYYYGDSYLVDWFEMNYKVLKIRGNIDKIIRKQIERKDIPE